jgi:hypothetical protein
MPGTKLILKRIRAKEKIAHDKIVCATRIYKPKILPRDLQKIVLEYADFDLREFYTEFYRIDGSYIKGLKDRSEHNALSVMVGPAFFVGSKICGNANRSHPNLGLARLYFGITMGGFAALALSPVALIAGLATPVVAPLKDVSIFAVRKAKEAKKETGAKEIFDADLIRKKSWKR